MGRATIKQGMEPMTKTEVEPRWPAILAVLAIGALHLSLPESLTIGPDWLLLAVVSVLALISMLARRSESFSLAEVVGYTISGLITMDMAWSLWRLVAALPAHSESPKELLRSAAILWITNILVFASWYWRLDAGGPNARDLRMAHIEGAFLFPQMTMDPKRLTKSERGWTPSFIDYLFLAFNTSTAFSPTDSPVLSRWAKCLMMVQAFISFTTVALLAARAVNIL